MANIAPDGKPLFIWLIVITSSTTFVVMMRFWAALLMKRPFAKDDGLVIFAYMNLIINAAWFFYALLRGGFGKHTPEFTLDEQVIMAKLVFVSSIVWLLGNVFCKLSILFLYNRIFTLRPFRIASYIVIGFTVAYCVSFLGIFVSHCQPVSNSWNPVPGGWCRDLSAEEFSSTSLSLVIDLIIILLPMRVLWGLQMTVYKRIGLSIMFSIGLITIGVMCWRIEATAKSVLHPTDDPLHELLDVGLIVMLELWLGVTVACVPTLAPLLSIYIAPLVSRMLAAISARDSKAGGSFEQTPIPLETIGAKRSRRRGRGEEVAAEVLGTGK
ncbi:hypothetical protein GGR54DRAFT_184949 [Hypoxylon sp. NC1633]|nr:hypothetical protein GGR54DRAFT_184949 [Hypoxylon sp. NC1633]